MCGGEKQHHDAACGNTVDTSAWFAGEYRLMRTSLHPTRTDCLTPQRLAVHIEQPSPASPRHEEDDQHDHQYSGEHSHQYVSLAPAGRGFAWSIHVCLPLCTDDPGSLMDVRQRVRAESVQATYTSISTMSILGPSFVESGRGRPVGLQERPDLPHPHRLRHLPRPRPGPAP